MSTGDIPSVAFVSVEDTEVGGSGSAEILIRAAEAGTIGNVAENTIILQDSPIDGVESLKMCIRDRQKTISFYKC